MRELYIKYTIYILLTLSLFNALFFDYFGKDITSSDITLFFNHFGETFETFFSLTPIFFQTILIYLLLFIFTHLFFKFSSNLTLALFTTLTLFNYIDFNILREYPLFGNRVQTLNKIDSDITPVREVDADIVFIVGESLRFDIAKEFFDFDIKKAISSATNTDVAIPLLLNSKESILEIDSCKSNLFYLAKVNKFKTTFISTQKRSYLKHIDRYLCRDYIDFYSTSDGKLDSFLLDEISKVDFREKNFIIVQMLGEHSPYKNYPKEFEKFKNSQNFKEKIVNHYKNSTLYSNYILKELVERLKLKSDRAIYFIFTSDHGESLGEGGKFGHNNFSKEIYEVPFFIQSYRESRVKSMFDRELITSHYQINSLLHYLLGFKIEFKVEKLSNIVVNGTMQNREDGYIILKELN